MSSQSPSASYDLIKIQPRNELRGDNYNNRGRVDTTEHEDNERNDPRAKTNVRENFVKFLSGLNLNTTVKNTFIPTPNKSNVFEQERFIAEPDAILTAKTSDVALVGIQSDNTNILASDGLILSDLLAIDLDALQNGDVISLPNDIDVSLKGGLLSFNLDGDPITTPEFSLEQFETLQLGLENSLFLNDGSLIDELSADDVLASPLLIPHTQIDTKFVQKNVALPQLNTVREVITLLQSAALTKDVLSQNISAPKTLDIKALSLGSSDLNKSGSTSSLSSFLSDSGKGLGASGVQSLSASFSNPNSTTQTQQFNAVIEQNLAINNALSKGGKIAVDESETLTQFLNNNNLRVVKEGHLQGTQPLATSQVNVVLSKMANGSQFKRLSVRLDPPELGRVDIKLSTRTSDNSLRAHIVVERPEALALLRRDLSQLEKMLSQSGLKLDSDSISFELASDDGNNDSQTQEALKDLWQERNENALNKNLASNLQSEQHDDDALSLHDNEDFYQSDDALNIRV